MQDKVRRNHQFTLNEVNSHTFLKNQFVLSFMFYNMIWNISKLTINFPNVNSLPWCAYLKQKCLESNCIVSNLGKIITINCISKKRRRAKVVSTTSYNYFAKKLYLRFLPWNVICVITKSSIFSYEPSFYA